MNNRLQIAGCRILPLLLLSIGLLILGIGQAYALPKTADVSLTVFDLSGREVTTLIDGQRSAGYHTVIFDGEGQPAGVYIVRLKAGGVLTSHKVTLVK